MPRRKQGETMLKLPKSSTALSPEARENQLIALAYNVAEERMRNGTASSQEIVHFLRLGSIRERKELELLNKKIELDSAKTEALQSAKRIESLYTDAIAAFRSYQGLETDEDLDEDIF